MNICILTFDYPPHPVYGSGVYVDFLTKLLRKANHEVRIITVNRFGLISEDEAVFCDCSRMGETLEKGKCVCSFGGMDCVDGLFEKTINRFKTENFIPDVLYVNGYMFFELANKLRTVYSNAKLVSCIHYLAEQDNVPEDNPERKRIFDEETRMIVSSDEIIYFGELAYRLIEKRNICAMDKLHYIPHAYNIDVHTRSFKKRNRFVYVSRLEPGKGIEHLCKALDSIDEDFSFDIIGEGRLRENIQEKYGNRFKVHGYQNKDYVIQHLIEADFFVLPSFSEHCPVVVLEGMACGCIPMLSTFGELPQNIKDHSSGIVFELEQDEERFIKNIKNAISRALSLDKATADEMIATNYKLLQKYYSPEIMLKNTLSVFEA